MNRACWQLSLPRLHPVPYDLSLSLDSSGSGRRRLSVGDQDLALLLTTPTTLGNLAPIGTGRPKLTWGEEVKRDLKEWNISKDLAMDRSAWRLSINVPEQ